MAGKGMYLFVLFLMKLCVIALHLVSKRSLWTAECFCDLTIRNFRIVESHLDDTVCVRIKLTEPGNAAIIFSIEGLLSGM